MNGKNITISGNESFSFPTSIELKRLTKLFVKEMREKNKKDLEGESFFTKFNNWFDENSEESGLEKDIVRGIQKALYGADEKEKHLRKISENDEETKVFIVRDNDKKGKIIGFSLATIGKNASEERGILNDSAEPNDKIIGSKFAAYMLPEYRNINNATINGDDSKESMIALALNREIDKWFEEKEIKIEYTSTGINMPKNILAYVQNGYFPRISSDTYVQMKKEKDTPLNLRQKMFLARMLKMGNVFNYRKAVDVPEYSPEKHPILAKSKNTFDERYILSHKNETRANPSPKSIELARETTCKKQEMSSHVEEQK